MTTLNEALRRKFKTPQDAMKALGLSPDLLSMDNAFGHAPAKAANDRGGALLHSRCKLESCSGSIRARSSSMLARPYMERLSVFNRLI
jgi:hypothetical protein